MQTDVGTSTLSGVTHSNSNIHTHTHTLIQEMSFNRDAQLTPLWETLLSLNPYDL